MDVIDRIPKDILYRMDLAYFAEEVLGIEINQHHETWSELVARNKKICALCARDHGKSYFFSFAYAIWRSYYNWTPSGYGRSLGYIFAHTQDQSIKYLSQIKDEIEQNPKLKHLLPEKKEVWSMQEIKMANGARIRVRGWGVAVRGGHPSWAICDDILDDDIIYSEGVRNKTNDYFFSAIVPMVVPGGQLVVVGTPFTATDLYSQLQRNPIYAFARFPALNEVGDALWPTRYSKESLLSRRQEVGSTRFSREYLCSPISAESTLFPEHILQKCFDEEFSMGIQLEKNLTIYQGVDLAISANVGADYTVITTLGIDELGCRWILDVQRKKGLSMTDQLLLIESTARRFKPVLIFIEDNGFSQVFRDSLITNTDLPIQGWTTTARNKNSLEAGLPTLQVLFENRKIIIPRKSERDKYITDILIHELINFTFEEGKVISVGEHDDMVMSLHIANQASQSSPFSFQFIG